MMNQTNIDYLSGEVRQILGKPPSRVTHWVFAITSGMITLLIFASFIFRYPEIIDGELILSTAEAPFNVDAPKTGVLATVKVKEGDLVTKNQLIAIFENDADVDDVLELENDLNKLNNLDEDAIRAFTPNRSLDLDQQLDILYQEFISSLEFVPLYEGDQIDQEAINGVYAENSQTNRSNRQLLDAIQSAEDEIVALDKRANNIYDLYQKQPSKEAYSNDLITIDQEKKSLRTEINRYRAEIEKNNEKIKNNNSKILLLKADRKSGTQERIYQLRQNISKLRRAIAEWKSDNIVYSPANGRVSFYANLELKKRYKKGEELVAIIPVTENTDFIGLVKIPVEGSGKVENGQSVNLKFDRYPFLEFGQVKGTVTKIYPLSVDGTYAVEVALENGLVTNQGKTLEYYQQMGGQAEIITDERLFVGRLYDKLLGFWK